MMVRVLLFAAAKEIVGQAEIEMKLGDAVTVGGLKQQLLDQYPALGPLLGKSALAVAQRYAADDEVLTEGVEVGIIPPVSGG